ncbi:MAG: hypothetical protein CMK09_01570 [Ponticaulis sp.]|nr:hypothetical protein [Ponticaulis sp.]|tara:strand:+ start:8426 stop:8854 length:429 start_codon:yes stop_codon:yes gene_type:complete
MPDLKAALMAMSALSLSGMASADEVWTIMGEEVVYEEDLANGMAVLAHGDGKLFIQGLAGQYEGRGTYDGIFIDNSEFDVCDVAIVNPQTGESTYNWGRVRMVFIDPDFPSRWVAMGSECFGKPIEDPIVAMPVTGDPPSGH